MVRVDELIRAMPTSATVLWLPRRAGNHSQLVRLDKSRKSRSITAKSDFVASSSNDRIEKALRLQPSNVSRRTDGSYIGVPITA